MFAIISHKGKQYKVVKDKECKIDLIDDSVDKKIVFNQVLLIEDGDKIVVGTPYIDKALVEAEKIENIRGGKIRVFKFNAKKRYKRTAGHKQKYTVVKIKDIKL